jgi:hypothetical protein
MGLDGTSNAMEQACLAFLSKWSQAPLALEQQNKAEMG